MNYSDHPHHDFWCQWLCTWHAPAQPAPKPCPDISLCGVGLPESPPWPAWWWYNAAFDWPYEDVYRGEEVVEIGACGLPHMTAAYDRYHKFLPDEPPTHWTISARGDWAPGVCKVCFPPRVPEWQPGDKPTGRDPEAVRVIAQRKRVAEQP